VKQIVIKPQQTRLKYAWIIAVWTPRFTQFMHDYLKTRLEEIEKMGFESREENPPELFIGEVVQKAIEEGLMVEGVKFPEHGFQDIGSPEGLRQAASWRE
jgi:glucose-1-phosphate thymidylyltransferase